MKRPDSVPRRPANTVHEARERYTEYLQRSLGCITKAVWAVGPAVRGRPDLEWVLSLPNGGRPIRVPLEAGGHLLLSASQRFVLVDDRRYPGEYKTSTREYIYKVSEGSQAASQQPVFEWHWHPSRGPAYPHVHAHPPVAAEIWGEDMGRRHLPSGRVSLEEVIEFLLVDLHAVPVADDWRERLDEALRAFRSWQTWPGGLPIPDEPAEAQPARPKKTTRQRPR